MSRKSGRSLTFKDAVRLLDDGSPFVRDLDELISHAFDAVPVAGPLLGLPYFAFRRKLVAYGEKVVSGIRDRVDGVGRYDRTQRLNAAHMVIVMTAFADAVGELLDGSGLQGRQASGESVADGAHGRLILDFANIDVPDPGPGRVEWIESLYVLTEDLSNLLITWGLAPDAVHVDELPELARRRYEEYYRRLAAQVPEFAVWAYLAEHEATRGGVAEVGCELREVGEELRTRLDAMTTGLAAIPELLVEMSERAAANYVREDLAHRYQAVLRRSVLGETRAPDGFVLPTLEHGYVNPAVRATVIDANCRPSEDGWWEEQPSYEDVQALIAGMLTLPDAVDRPLVVLGQPGAGKSVLTRILSARLADRGFLPVRVELRNVPADAEIQAQIEHGIHDTIGRTIEWPELARPAHEDGLLPLVILDGFDELLQATGVNRTDYLEQVARFQQRELDLGRPVAVIVTSRTAVADRARFPEHTLALRIEPFDEGRVATWLGVWNAANGTSLETATMRRFGELAEQPLLLTLLALYDAGTGALGATEAGLSRAELYDRLLSEFARREVRKSGEGMERKEEDDAVAKELLRLEIVALAMFNRHAKAITGEELDRDLAVLLPGDHQRAPGGTGLAKPLTAAQLMVGRFFFVHESSARRAEETEHAYEFLHATFGEFLVARYVVELLRSLARLRAFQENEGAVSSTLDDGKLWAALSFAALTGSKASVEFTEGLLSRLPDNECVAVRELTVELLKDAAYANPRRSLADYVAVRLPVFKRHSRYSANLVLLALLATGEPLEFHPDDLLSWWPGLGYDEFIGMRDAVRVIRVPGADGNMSRIVREDGSDVIPYESWRAMDLGDALLKHEGRYPLLPAVRFPARSEAGVQIRTQPFIYRWDPNIATLMPYFAHVGQGVSSRVMVDETPVTYATLLLELRLAPLTRNETRRRLALYQACIFFGRHLSDPRWQNLIYRQLREDLQELDPSDVASLLSRGLRDVPDATSEGFLGLLYALRDVDEVKFRELVDSNERIRELLERIDDTQK